MPSRRKRNLLGWTLAVCLVGATFAVPAGSQAQQVTKTQYARATASLSVCPKVFIPGQPLTFEGNIGTPGRQRIHLQFKGQMPNDKWDDEQGFHAYTDRRGHFKFTFPGPAMSNRNYRVVARSGVTPRWVAQPRTPEALISLDTGSLRLPDGVVLLGEPFKLAVDTAPDINGRSDLPPPVFPGREVELQKRDSKNRWQTVSTAQVGIGGFAFFPLTLASLGTEVFRVRVDDLTQQGYTMGWYPSFPFVVDVLRSAPRETSTALRSTSGTEERRVVATSGVEDTTATVTDTLTARAGGETNASAKYDWHPSVFDFAWAYGESLSSRPWRGTDRRGRWTDFSNGTGRARLNGGGLRLESHFGFGSGPGDSGTTSVTMHGNARAYGRWEIAYRARVMENTARDFDVRIELVPEDPADYHCGANNILIGETSPHSKTLRLAASSRKSGSTWSRTLKGVDLGTTAHNFAVEVTRGHITWFLDARPLATVKNRAAISGVPLTPRLSMVGDGQREMNRMNAIFDWVRGWDLSSGRHPVAKASLRKGSLSGGC